VEENLPEQTAGSYRARHPEAKAQRNGLTEALKIALALPSRTDVIDPTFLDEEQEKARLRRMVEKHREHAELDKDRRRRIVQQDVQSASQRIWRGRIPLLLLVLAAIALFVTVSRLIIS
jgi:hypothetical protein